MITILSVIFVIGLLVFIHESGHFLVAKWLGVRVEKFSLGFGPKLFRFKKGHTEYMICALPLGGYVKLGGDETGAELKRERWEFLSRSPWERNLFVRIVNQRLDKRGGLCLEELCEVIHRFQVGGVYLLQLLESSHGLRDKNSHRSRLSSAPVSSPPSLT